jgi:hypothetical protein
MIFFDISSDELSFVLGTFSFVNYTDTALKVSIVKLMQEYRFINLDHQTCFLLLTSSVLVDHVNNEN